MPAIELFLQFEGDRRIELVEIDADAPVHRLIEVARSVGLPEDRSEGALVFGLDAETPLDRDLPLSSAGIAHRQRVHVHRCRQIEVTLHFNDVTETMRFAPSATVERVKRRFVEELKMSPVDATEHVLEVCGTSDRPEPDLHIGSLTCNCSLCFSLVPIKRVEG